MKVTDNVCVPDVRTVPDAGVYVKVPATVEVAFNCAALKAVPYETDAGAAQLIVGVTLLTVRVTVQVKVLLSVVSVGVKVAESVCVPAVNTAPNAGE